MHEHEHTSSVRKHVGFVVSVKFCSGCFKNLCLCRCECVVCGYQWNAKNLCIYVYNMLSKRDDEWKLKMDFFFLFPKWFWSIALLKFLPYHHRYFLLAQFCCYSLLIYFYFFAFYFHFRCPFFSQMLQKHSNWHPECSEREMLNWKFVKQKNFFLHWQWGRKKSHDEPKILHWLTIGIHIAFSCYHNMSIQVLRFNSITKSRQYLNLFISIIQQ